MATSDYIPIQLILFPLEKCCSKCQRVKSIGQFTTARSNRDGFRTWCKDCDRLCYQNKRTAAIRRVQRELGVTRRVAQAYLAAKRAETAARLAEQGLKRCSDCHVLQPRASFHRNKWQADGLTNLCKACMKKRRHAHYLANRARVLAQTRAWQGANKARIKERTRLRKKERPEIYAALNRRIHARRRARHNGAEGHHTDAEWRALCAACGNVCACCGAAVPLTADHIVPISKGGSDWISNIQPLCGRCNSSKGARTMRYIP